MKLAIITHVSHGRDESGYFAYGPYVREMNVWLEHVDEMLIVAPKDLESRSPIDLNYVAKTTNFYAIPAFDIKTGYGMLKTLFWLPLLFWTVFRAMKHADHIHLRCPGNMGLIGCIAQIFFPNKKKSAKYAGNWDPNSKQPLSYRIQKSILNNKFLTRNMQVLVYGEWPGSTKNIKPFFTATYSNSERVILPPRELLEPISFLFVGTLSEGKQPLYALELVESLSRRGIKSTIAFYGEGSERDALESYISKNGLQNAVQINGNRSERDVRSAYQSSHFLLLPSKSEGWPKVVAEAMFWGCVPIATPVSCVPFMLDSGRRGVLLSLDLTDDSERVSQILSDKAKYNTMATESIEWSQQYTLDLFSEEIKTLLHP